MTRLYVHHADKGRENMPNDPTETNSAQGDIQATDAILQRIKEIDVELAAYIKTIQHADEATFAAMSAHVDELLRERCRAMGLPEDEITRIEQES